MPCFGGDDHGVWLANALQTRCHIWRFAQRRALLRGPLADHITDNYRSRRYTDPYAQFDSAFGKSHVQLPHPVNDTQARPNRALRVLFVGLRITEVGQNAVADVSRNKSLVTFD